MAQPPQQAAAPTNAWAAGWNRFVSGVQKGIQEKQEEIRIGKEAKEAGKVWNAEKKEWVFYFIEDELKELEAKADQFGDRQPKPGGEGGGEEERKVADRSYYDLLECSTNADANQVSESGWMGEQEQYQRGWFWHEFSLFAWPFYARSCSTPK